MYSIVYTLVYVLSKHSDKMIIVGQVHFSACFFLVVPLMSQYKWRGTSGNLWI